MNKVNSSAELTSTTLKIQMLRDEIASDIKNGTEFHSLIPVSAREYFGSKWLDKVLGRMDSIEIFKYSDKDRLIPYDLILSGMAASKEEYHTSGHEERNNVMLYLNGKDFEGKVSVLSADTKKAVLGMVWKSSFSGTYVNAKDIEPAEKEIETLEQRLSQIMNEVSVMKKEPVVESVIPTATPNFSPVPVPSHSRFLGYAMLSIGLCLTLYSVI